MSEQLKGTLAERIRDLRREQKLSQSELADAIGINRATISRIENGDPVMSDIAVKLAEYFGVSVDYLFGLTDEKSPVNFDLKSLGISAASAQKLYSGEIDSDVLNMILEHPDFGAFSKAVALYFSDVIAKGTAVHNTVLDELSRIVADMRSDNADEAANDISLRKTPADEFDIYRLNNMFADILKDIKGEIGHGHKKEEKMTKEIVASLEQSVGKHNLAIRRINAERLATGVVDAISARHSLTEEMRNNLTAAFIPLFANDVSKKKG